MQQSVEYPKKKGRHPFLSLSAPSFRNTAPPGDENRRLFSLNPAGVEEEDGNVARMPEGGCRPFYKGEYIRC